MAIASFMRHADHGAGGGPEAIRIVSGPLPQVTHRFYHVPASNTAVGHAILENKE